MHQHFADKRLDAGRDSTFALSSEGGRGSSAPFSTRSPKSSDSTSPKGSLPQWPITQHALAVEPTENELFGALRSMANVKAVDPDELPVEPLKRGINYAPIVLSGSLTG